MKRATLAVFTIALLAAMAWPVSRAIGGIAGDERPGPAALCEQITARMLEHPALAEEWAQAFRSSQPDEIARMRAILGELRAAHGCPGATARPRPEREPGALPPGHPPIPGRDELPPGHPPVQSSPPRPALFQPPEVVTI
jgi:hypothetical protein